MSVASRIASLFATQGPESSYPVLPQVRENAESSVRGIYLVGEVGGTPLIKLGLNQGVDIAERLYRELGAPSADDPEHAPAGQGAPGQRVGWAPMTPANGTLG